MGADLDLPDDVYGFGSWLLWVLATRATTVVDEAFAAGPARPSRHYGMADGHPVPTPSLVAWLLTAAEAGLPAAGLAQRDRRLDERQKVLRTIVSRAIGGEPRLFKDSWLRDLAAVCGLGQAELDLLYRCRGEEGHPVDPAPLRAAITRTLQARPAGGGHLPFADGTAPRSLPRDITSFTGREAELETLMAAAGGVVAVCAVGGMAGVGKTAFAVHTAHRLANRFPDGQIFLPLHGHTPGQQPVNPVDALASLLLILGVPAGQIPPGLEARMALWRDRLTQRQLLLVLDDAVSSEQVRPLLPGAGSLVLITSRRHLSALEDAAVISLDILAPDQAAGLLVRLAARPGLGPADPAVGELTRLCGYLPLAIGMVARQLHHHPAWPLAGHAADLATARDRLELMVTENLSVAAAFNLSYEDLTGDQQRLFRRLGLHPGTDVDAYAAAALDDTDLTAARRGLEALYDQYLLTEPAQGRYRMHDLLREHAHTLSSRLDADADRDQATARLLDYYQQAAAVADSRLALQTRATLACEADAEPAAVPALADREQALGWARAERGNLLACLDQATGTGHHARVIALTAGLAGLLLNDGPWAEAVARHAIALNAAQRLGDLPAQANALNDLGTVQVRTDEYTSGMQAVEEALDIYRAIGDRLGQANALTHLGDMRGVTGDYPGAALALEEALDIYRAIGDRPGQANALRELGEVRYLTSDCPGAAQAMEETLDIYRAIGDRLGQANTLTNLGDVRRMTGDYPGAARDLQEALDIYRDLGHRHGHGNALTLLGRIRLMTGDYPGAARDLEEALHIKRDIGDRRGQSNALSNLGDGRRMTGDYPGAARDLEEALGICRDIGDRGGEVEVLNKKGALHRVRGDLSQARSCHQQSLDLAREIGSAWDEAHALAGLGRCAHAAGHAAEAEDQLEQALKIFRRIGTAEIADVAAELNAIRTTHPHRRSSSAQLGPHA